MTCAGFFDPPPVPVVPCRWILKKLVRNLLAPQVDAGNGALQLLPPLPLYLPKLPKIAPILPFAGIAGISRYQI
jgi:hypothetical protein